MCETLWHYTSVEVFAEFVKSEGKFWGTHHGFLNDREEVEYGRKIFDQWIQDKRSEDYSVYLENEI